MQSANQVGRAVRTGFCLRPFQRPRLVRAICLKGMDTPVDDGQRKFMSTPHPNRFDFAWMEVADICALHVRDTQADCCPRFGAENGRAVGFISVKEASEHRTVSRR